MNNEVDYKGIARSIFEAMNSGDFTKFQHNAMENVSLDFPGTDRIEGVKRLILFFKVLLRKYKNLTFDIKEVIVGDKKACVVWTNSGLYDDDSLYKNSGITLFHFEEDKISFISDYFKDTSFTNSK